LFLHDTLKSSQIDKTAQRQSSYSLLDEANKRNWQRMKRKLTNLRQTRQTKVIKLQMLETSSIFEVVDVGNLLLSLKWEAASHQQLST
jgi:hypothetical protein